MLPEQDWLPLARTLAVGQRTRTQHLHEHRLNLVVANDRDRWWAYCQRCREGAVIQKEHVFLGGPAQAITAPPSRDLPRDRVRVLGSDYEGAVALFLASKDMDAAYLPELWVAPSDRRLLLQAEDGTWHGRDISGRSPMKWTHYGSAFVGAPGATTVVVEDLFSMWKVRYAMRPVLPVSVCCTLGAHCADAAALALKSASLIVWLYDADAAGDDGATSGMRRMRPFGPRQLRARPPDGMDPKNLQIQKIRDLLLEIVR